MDTPSHTGCVLPPAKILQWPAQPIPDGITDSGQAVYLSDQYKKPIKFPKYRCERQPSPCVDDNGDIKCPSGEQIDGGYICSPIQESK